MGAPGIEIRSTIDADPPAWLVVPHPEAVDGEWIESTLAVLRALAQIDAAPDGERADAELALVRLLDIAAELPSGHRLVAGLGVARQWPLPVIVSVRPADPEADLLALAGAVGGLPVSPPTIEELPTEDGPVVLRYDIDDRGAVLASASWARRRDGVDTVALWRTTELTAVPAFLPDLVALAELIGVEITDTEGVTP